MKRIPLILTVLLCAAFSSANAQSTITVPTDFGTIQEAIDASSPGDAIEVLPGIYYESIVIPFGLTIRGKPGNSEDVVVHSEPEGWGSSLLQAGLVPSEQQVVIEALTFEGCYVTAIVLTASTDILIRGCIFRDNQIDIGAFGSTNLIVEACSLEVNYEFGIVVRDSAEVLVKDSSIDVGVGLAAIDATGPCSVNAEESSFASHIIISKLYVDRAGGIQAYNGPTMFVKQCHFSGFSTAIWGRDCAVLAIDSCEFVDGLFGIALWTRTNIDQVLPIVGNSFHRMHQPIKLMAAMGIVDISRNSILEMRDGPALNFCLAGCVSGGCVDLPSFAGELVGSGNVIEEGPVRTCPPFRAPFWPEGFVTD